MSRDRIPAGAGCCAYDLDECTVTIALATDEQVKALVAALPPRNRVRLDSQPPSASEQIRHRAQKIVAIANQCEGMEPEALYQVPVHVIRAAAMIVNGKAFEPLMMASLQSRMGEAEEALRPFAEAAIKFQRIFSTMAKRALLPEGMTFAIGKYDGHREVATITLADLRRASTFLQKQEQQP